MGRKVTAGVTEADEVICNSNLDIALVGFVLISWSIWMDLVWRRELRWKSLILRLFDRISIRKGE